MNRAEIKRRQIQLITFVLGLVNLWIFGRKISDAGVAYLAAALFSLSFVWALTARQVPDAMGRILRARNAKGQYKNAAKMRKCIMIFQGILGAVFAVALFAGAGLLADKVWMLPYSKSLIMVLAPVLLFRTVNAVLIGIFQGEGNELPTALSSLMRQVFILVFGTLLAKSFGRYGVKVSALFGQDAFTMMYGGLGVAAGILIAEVLVTVFLLLIYRSVLKKSREKEAESMKAEDSFVGQVRALYASMGLPMLCGLLELLPLWIGLVLSQKYLQGESAAESFGVYAGKYLVLGGIPLCLLAALLLPVAVKAAERSRSGDHRVARNAFQICTKSLMIHGLFFSAYFTVMAGQLAGLFGKTNIETLKDMLVWGSFGILFGLMAVIALHVLKVLGKNTMVLACLAGYNVVFILAVSLWFKGGNAGILSLVYAGVIAVCVLAVGALSLVFGYLRCRTDLLRMVALPGACACVAGLLCFLLGKVLTPHLGNGVTLLVTFVLALGAYWMGNLLLRVFGRQELNIVPGGKILAAIGQLLRVF
ncbi:MAG: hypothetical protein E7286_03955 [Lachnospiraceae bacterium]|nr:hypothetical protein [Lachnospiraceae bacterium]